MHWCKINHDYLGYLRSYESHIPYDDYPGHYKPFFRPLFIKDNLEYVTHISHSQAKYKEYRTQMDFKKVFLHSKNGTPFLAGVVFLNDMFPVPLKPKLEFTVTGRNIDKVRKFKTFKLKSKYINFLKKERKVIEKMNLGKKAQKLYKFVQNNPDSVIAKRCFNFSKLEKLANDYALKKEHND